MLGHHDRVTLSTQHIARHLEYRHGVIHNQYFQCRSWSGRGWHFCCGRGWRFWYQLHVFLRRSDWCRLWRGLLFLGRVGALRTLDSLLTNHAWRVLNRGQQATYIWVEIWIALLQID